MSREEDLGLDLQGTIIERPHMGFFPTLQSGVGEPVYGVNKSDSSYLI